MARLNVAPTKSNYLQLRRNLSFIKEGFDLLNQKREILVIELMHTVERAKYIQRAVADRMREAYEALARANMALGTFNVKREALACTFTHELRITHRRLMGLDLPTVEAKNQPRTVQGSLGGSSAELDEVIARFLSALELIAELAQIENSVWRLARELRKTQRRVNALEKIFIPSYEETIKYIADTLEEKEREAFFLLKLIKGRLHPT